MAFAMFKALPKKFLKNTTIVEYSPTRKSKHQYGVKNKLYVNFTVSRISRKIFFIVFVISKFEWLLPPVFFKFGLQQEPENILGNPRVVENMLSWTNIWRSQNSAWKMQLHFLIQFLAAKFLSLLIWIRTQLFPWKLW